MVTHMWTIEDLTVASFTGADSGERWNGPEFEAGGLRWRLEVRPNTLHRNLKVPGFGVFLCLLDQTSAPVVFAEVLLQVRGVAAHKFKKSFYTGDAQHFPEALPCSHNWGNRWTHEELARRADTILFGGQMVISVTLRSRSFADLELPTLRAPLLPTLIAALLPASGSELAGGVDVVFKAAGERIGAHSLILALRSSTLRASLWGPLAAQGVSQPRELDIPEGIDTATFRCVLAFMYTDAVPDLDFPDFPLGQIHALLHAADYLDVPALREICIAELQMRLAPENAVATLKLAHALSCMLLLDASMRYIAANLSAVMRTPGWAELSLEPGLMQAVVSTVATGEPPVKVVLSQVVPEAGNAN